MKHLLTLASLLLISVIAVHSASVAISELPDRIQVKIDDQIFTEWRHKEWSAPFLYPVIGPNGENVTRHFPMKAGMPGEDPDHPHHRSIRFSHSDVNSFNFWWSPDKAKAGHTTEVKLEKIEKMTSGKTGEVVLWNHWLGDGKLVLREKVRLAFTPLENRQVLMDYDVELQAGDTPVVFGDKRDGGMLVRVAGTMKVESEKGVKGEGAILNSRGDRNADAWGKRAEWTDYSGPDASGKTIGIAMFDHPANLRFPTLWHARTYGLMTAYRQVLTLTGKSNGWLPISATLSVARLLNDQLKTDEALDVLKQYGNMDGMAPVWRIKMLRAYGRIYAAQGKEQESLAKFREALRLESKP